MDFGFGVEAWGATPIMENEMEKDIETGSRYAAGNSQKQQEFVQTLAGHSKEVSVQHYQTEGLAFLRDFRKDLLLDV